MKKNWSFIKRFALLSMLGMLVSCASIVMPKSSRVALTTEPKTVDVEVSDQGGKVIYNGETPAYFTLSRGSGFFQKATYDIKLSADTVKPVIISIVNDKVNGWYVVGNIFFGGLLGWLIIDPVTGAMWKWGEPTVTQGDALIQGEIKGKESTLHVTLKEVTPELVEELGLKKIGTVKTS